MDIQTIMEKLQAPFEPNEIEWRVGATNGKPKANPPVPATKGIALAYVTNRAIQNRLDDVFGCFGWQNEFKEWKGNSQICGISVLHEGQWITKWDGADDSNTEATKGGLSDSMKRAAYQWGIGRYLYKLPQTWVALKNGKYLAETPSLPDWALPKGYKGDGKGSVMPIDLAETPQEQPKPSQEGNKPSGNKPTSKGNIICEKCNKEITEKVAMYSTSKYGKKLCMDCQKLESKVS